MHRQSFSNIGKFSAFLWKGNEKRNWIRVPNFSSKRFLSVKNAQVVRFDTNGQPEQVLRFATEELPSNLGPSEILVKMLAAPINPADLNMIEGNYGLKVPLPAVGGNEGVGVILEVGSNVKNLSINDKVIPSKSGLGTWRTHGVFKDSDFQKIPSDIQNEYAATVSVNPSTAFRLLEDFVQLKPGDVIVQNGANSMVGQAVIQLAKQRDIKTINIIRNRPDFAEVVERLKAYGGYMVVSDEYMVTPPFRRLLTDLPKPKLALNAVGGPSATEIARLLNDGGTMVTYGGMSRKPVTVPTSQLIFKDITLKGFWLTRWVEQHSTEERSKMLNTLFDFIKGGKLKLWMETVEFGQFPYALQKVKDPHRGRKVVLKM